MAEFVADQSMLDKVRANPKLYLSPGRTTDLRDISIELANDAVYLGAQHVTIERLNDWHIVAASMDWLVHDSKRSAWDSFFRLQRLDQYRQNATRATILVAAFCADVVTFFEGNALLVQGCTGGVSELDAYIARSPPSHRVVAFRGSLGSVPSTGA